MSRDIRIQEGGVSRLLTVDKLRTALDGGGSCLWVPEADVALGTRTIRSNGTYYAADDGFYGYSRVTVKGIGTATGKASDGSGDDATATVDPETGQITISKLPSSIVVVTPPTNEYGIYQDGQTIETAGMVVKGYTASGEEWGTVPVGEITIEPTTAVYDEATDTEGESYAESDLLSWQVPLGDFIPTLVPLSGPWSISPTYRLGFDGHFRGNRGVYGLVVSDEEGYRTLTKVTYSWDKDLNVTVTEEESSQPHYDKYTYNGKTVYWSAPLISASSMPLRDSRCIIGENAEALEIHESTSAELKKIAWTLMYGNKTIIPSGSRQTITASWARPGDGKVLTAEFEILVAPGYGSDE